MMPKISFNKALSLLQSGEVVALPTETVYGLAGRIDRKSTLKKIFKLKKRPLFDPLIIHCRDTKQVLDHISGQSPIVEKLFNFFSPGPLTVVAKKNKKISSLVTARKRTAAFRVPQHILTKKILKQLSIPLAIPSANLYGKISPVSASHVISAFKGLVPVLDGGACEKGLESTIVFPDTKKKKIFILRPGMITKENIQSFLDKHQINWGVEHKQDPFQPGGQKSHYRPPAPLYIVETQKKEEEVRYFLSQKFPDKNLKKFQMESSPRKTAKTLYSHLRQISSGTNNILFVIKTKKQSQGLWSAIWNRLTKASLKHYKI